MEQKEESRHRKRTLQLALWSLVVLCLGLVVGAYFFAGLVLLLATLLLLVLIVALTVSLSYSDMLPSNSARALGLVAIVLGLLGSVIGIWCALSAFQAVGTNPAYSGRLWAAWAAFLLPILAALATLFLRTRPLAASLLIIVSGLAGAVCINLFSINTYYVLAIPFWILAVAVGIASHSRTNTGQRIQDE